MKMIELKNGLYLIQGDKYVILPKNRREVAYGKTITTREVRGDYAHADYSLTGIVKGIESGLLVLSPATSRSTYAVDFGHVYEVTTELEEAKISIENIESIVGMENRENGAN